MTGGDGARLGRTHERRVRPEECCVNFLTARSHESSPPCSTDVDDPSARKPKRFYEVILYRVQCSSLIRFCRNLFVYQILSS